MAKYDFSEVYSGKLIDPGIYEAIIVDIKSGESKKGDVQRQVVFQLSNGETVSDFLVETDKALWKIQKLFMACGLPHEGIVKVSDDWREVKDANLRIQVGTEEYKGQKRSRVIAYYPVAQGEEEPESE